MSDNSTKTKSFANTYLYSMASGQYEKKLFDFIMTAEQINKKDPSFDDLKYEVKKRQISNSLVKVMESNRVILLAHENPLPKAFKVFAAKDVKGDGTLKVFIDCDVIKKVDGKWQCGNIDIFIAYLVSAMTQIIYFVDPKRLVMKDEIIKSGASAFSSLFTYIIDYLYKVTTVPSTRDKCIYLSAMYYMVNILQKDMTDSVKAVARNLSGLSEREEEMLLIQVDQENAFSNIKFFIDELNKVLKLSKLTLELFLEKWLYLYGTGTQFALELFPSFSSMMTNVYVGCYLNNQKTIEKITGRNMVEFTTAILRTGADAV